MHIKNAHALKDSTNKSTTVSVYIIIEKSKRRDVAIVDVSIPTNLICVLFDLAIPTSSFNFIQLFLYLYMYGDPVPNRQI